MVIGLALASALTFGVADFYGGLASKSAPATAVSIAAQLMSLAGLGLVLLISLPRLIAVDLAWGGASGGAAAIGVLLLYKGLAGGRMSVIAPITGLTAAGLPVLVSPLLGEVPSLPAYAGIGVALLAIVLISREPELDEPHPEGDVWRWRWIALGSGAAFGVLFLLLDQTSADSGVWPLIANKTAALVVLGIVGLVGAGRAGVQLPRRALPMVAVCAACGTAAEFLYLLATQQGLVAIAAVLTSFYPAATVLLANIVLHERFHRPQLMGFALATGAVALIALG